MKKRRMLAGIAFVMALVMASAGCGRRASLSVAGSADRQAAGSVNYAGAAYEEGDVMEDVAFETEADLGMAASSAAKMAGAGTDQATESGKKIVWSGYLRMESTEYEKTLGEMEVLFSRYQVQVESSEEYDGASWMTGEGSSRIMTWQLRIPSEHFHAFLEDAGELSGQIRNKSTSSSDQTKLYSDTTIQIESLTIQQNNLMEMMKKADTIEDMLAIEDRLADVRSQLRILSNTNSRIDYDVAYSSISVELQEVHVYQKENITFLQRLRQAAGNSLVEFVEALGDFCISFLYAIPYLVVLGVLFLAGRRIWRGRKQRREARREAREKEESSRKED